MIEKIKTLLKPVASLRITVFLLLVSMILVLAGTTAQRDMGIQDVQHQYFHAWWAKIQYHYFSPQAKDGTFAIDHFLASAHIPNWFPLPGGYSIIVAMIINLLAAHTVRFKLRWNRAGIIMIHVGLLVLLVSELLTSSFATEGQMRIDVGGSSNYTDDVRDAELAIVDPSSPDQDHVTVIPRDILANALGGPPIHDPQLPFDVKVERWYDNSDLVGPAQNVPDVDRLANAGAAKTLGIKRLAKYPGSEAEKIDLPSAFITLTRNGQPLGTYLVSLFLNKGMVEVASLEKPQAVLVDGKTYHINLRFRREYKPYTVYLDKFEHDVYLGTDEAKNFSSNVRLVDPTHHVDRTVRIWMNHPLCYNGETFYQQSFANNDKTSILQVVHNPASAWAYVAPKVRWLGISDESYVGELFNMPCLACLLGGLGLLIHFGAKLHAFLGRTLTPAEGTVGAMRKQMPPLPPGTKKKKGNASRTVVSNASRDRYVLEPEPLWPSILSSVLLVGLALTFLACWLSYSYPADKYNWDAFGELPISHEGRVLPLQTLARNSLKIISGKDYVKDKAGELVPQSKWLLDVMTHGGEWADYKVFRVDHDQIKDTLGLLPKERYFSWNDLFPKGGTNETKLGDQIKLASQVPEKDRDLGQVQLLEFAKHLNLVANFSQVEDIAAQQAFDADPARSRAMMEELGGAILKADPQFRQRMLSAGTPEKVQHIFTEAVLGLDQSQLNETEQQAFKDWYYHEMRRRRIANTPTESQLFVVAPLTPKEQWTSLGEAVADPAATPESATAFLKIVEDYQIQDPTKYTPEQIDVAQKSFNADVAAYRNKLNTALPSEMNKVSAEAFFNGYAPFFVSMLLYIGAFLTVCASWLVWRKPLGRAAFALMVLTVLIHTSGLIFRVYITAHGPVTNLYSSAIFIGWIIILLALGLEAIFRNGIGLATGAAAGFTSLLIGAALASTEGDTMKQVVAVLDTNFWLWTHVTCVTIGYASTFLAGALAIVYIRLNVTMPNLGKVTTLVCRAIFSVLIFGACIMAADHLQDLSYLSTQIQRLAYSLLATATLVAIDYAISSLADDKEAKKTLSRMIYGIICFALLFSFVGTILGGLWADKSWGRFWGWDPKENGAVLIVLWNALILHARWSGIVRERGMAVLAIVGNIVTSWSWFGTNMLGIGLHSYGFMRSAQLLLVLWMSSQVIIALLGMLPPGWWKFGGEDGIVVRDDAV